jgi:MFS family permease
MIAVKSDRLFNAACIALVVTAMSFAVRANLLGELGKTFNLAPREMGIATSTAFWGFTLAMLMAGALIDFVGLGRMYLLAFLGHVLGIALTIFASGFWTLFFSNLLIGIANGFIESASYTMISSLYGNQKAEKINNWHIWFPGGIVIGGVLSYFLVLTGANWKLQMITMLVPTLVYGVLFFRQLFPLSERKKLGVSTKQMTKECVRPLFLFMLFCMLLTGATELGTNQWIVELLATVGVSSILLLVFINGIMAIGRYYVSVILIRISTTGLLLLSAILSFIGLLWLGFAEGYTAFAAAAVFAVGVCFFWPTMIGYVAENLPKTGPLGLSLMGGAGLLSTSWILPYLGIIYENQLSLAVPAGYQLDILKAAPAGSSLERVWAQVKLAAGSGTLMYVSVLPAVLVVAFGFLHFMGKKGNCA